MSKSERSARRLFERAAGGWGRPESVALLHPEAEVTPSHDPTVTLSPSELGRLRPGPDEPRVIEARADTFHSLDDERVIVEGQVVIKDANGGIGYRPVVWALHFRDGLLYRSWAVSSVRAAETRLRMEPPEPAHARD